MKINLNDLQCLRKIQGVYFLYNEKEELVYIGQSGNMYTRILEHIVEDKKRFYYFKAFEFSNKTASEVMEVCLISHHKPFYNKLVVKDLKTWLMTIPPICLSELGKDENLSNYGCNSVNKIIPLMANDISNLKINSLFEYDLFSDSQL